MQKKHYFLLATMVVYRKEGLERQRHFNVLIPSEEQIVTRPQLGRAQQQAQVRFFTEFDTERKSEVTDVFIQSISYLGHMDEKTFHGEFYVEPEDRQAPAPAAANDAAAGMPADTDFAETDQVSETEVNVLAADMREVDPRFGTDDAGKQAQDRGE